MAPLMGLPSYQINNALIDFAPVNQAIDANRQNALMQRQSERADQQLALDHKRFGLQERAANDQSQMAGLEREQYTAKMYGGVAKQVLDLHAKGDVAGATGLYKRMTANPVMAETLRKHGVDPEDQIGVSRFLVTQAEGLRNSLDDQLKRAQIDKLRRGDEPDIVRTMRAGGIDPRSPEGQVLIRNSLKNNDPIGQIMMEAMRQPGQVPAGRAPQPQQQGGIVPQSYTGEQGQDGGVIPVQTAPQAAQGAPAQEPTVTFMGKPVPLSRAKVLAQALAADKSRSALGTMLNEDIGRVEARLGKEGNNKIDEKLINTSEQIARLDRISAQFHPDILTFEGRLKGGWLGFTDQFRSGNKSMTDQDRKYLVDFTKMRAESIANLNAYIKEITGAAMTESEAKRLMMAMPNAGTGYFDGDSPTQFKAKLDAVTQQAKYAMARAQYAKQTGKVWSEIPLDQMRGIMHQRGEGILKEMQAQAPGATHDQLKPFVSVQLKKEFGI